jgi:acetyl-CoA carboxylase biotin carboxylase subunit
MPSILANAPKPIHKVLIANRGEIAWRIVRTAREMGIETVVVFSEVDRNAPHVRHADWAFPIGPAPSTSSYLRGDYLIQLALDQECQAIHPGYGFLSENPAFARAVEEAGLLLVGPSFASMETMGNKVAAKQAVAEYNIPLVPGTEHPVSDPQQASIIAQSIGFPLLIKAAAGGGGKGMRVIQHIEELEEGLALAISEASNAFGDGSVFLEKFISSPRHIEIQLMADDFGNIVYLFERECSIQRRHQKLIEEAPSSCLDASLRKAMGEAAVRVAQACNYRNAGTVEFLLDSNNQFYFLEMNTRLQVEHPVTECISGLDLVRLQFEITAGLPLPIHQEDLRIIGHSIELRICAEDPRNQFLPDLGKLLRFHPPQGPGIRLDSGYEEGMEIPVHYDPLLAKLIVHAPNRPAAIARMKRALDEFEIAGPATTLDFGRWVMDQPAFVEGHYDTGFIATYFHGSASLDSPLPPWESSQEGERLTKAEEIAVSAFVLQHQLSGSSPQLASPSPRFPDAWHDLWKHG